jgi:predicted DNA-binding protein
MHSFSRERLRKLDLKLPPEIDAALAREARRAHKPKSALLRRAVEAYLEELADVRAVEVARSQGATPIPWAEVKRRHGLAG